MSVADDLLRFVPRRVGWDDVAEADRFDERFGAINATEGAIMDVTDNYVALTVDGDEATHDELVAWAWLIRPDLRSTLRKLASSAMREAIDYYDEQRTS